MATIVASEVQFVHKDKLFRWAGSLALEHIQRGCGIPVDGGWLAKAIADLILCWQ